MNFQDFRDISLYILQDVAPSILETHSNLEKVNKIYESENVGEDIIEDIYLSLRTIGLSVCRNDRKISIIEAEILSKLAFFV